MAYLREDVLLDVPPSRGTANSTAVTSTGGGAGTSATPAAAQMQPATGQAVQPVLAPGSQQQGSAQQASKATGTTQEAGRTQVRVPRVTFLFKLRQGAADESFGLNVAAIAGVPPQVVARAAVVAGRMREEAVAAAARAADVKKLAHAVACIRSAST